MGFDKQIDGEAVNRGGVGFDLLVALGFRSAEFQAIEGAFAGQGLGEVGFTGEEAEEGSWRRWS